LVEEFPPPSEERLRTALEASTDGLWDRDLVTGRVFHSARMNEMVGLPPVDMVVDTDTWRARMHPDDLLALAPEYERVLRGQQDRVDATYRVKCEDGTWKWIRSRAKVVARDASGSPLRFSGVVTDVTEQRRLEEALRASEALFRVAFENSSVGMALMSPDGRPIRVNRTLCEMVGYSEQELLKLNWRDLTHPDDLEPTTREIRRATATPEHGGRLEKRYIRKDGTEVWADVSSRVVLADGKVQHFITSVVDITDRKLAQEALRGSELRFRRLANEIPVGIYQTGPNGEMRFVNPTWLKITGLSEVEAFRPDAGKVIHPEDREQVTHLWNRAISTGTEFFGEYRLRGRDGTDTWVRGFGAAVRNEDGVVTGYVGALIDISEARRLQVELAQASRLAAMGTLVAGVAHEINNPLAATLANQGLVLEMARAARDEVLAGRSNKDQRARELNEFIEALEEAQASGNRISEIVKDMATFASPDPRRTLARLTDIAQGAMRWLPSSIGQSGKIQMEDRGAPEVMAASGQMEQVVHNLITNAVRASSEGGGIIIRIGPGMPGMARLEVIDHGVGIPDRDIDRIFEPFYTTRRVGEGRGAGLGLAISRAIVTAHGGTITVETEVGKGSTFRVELPAAPARA
jgi:PAS domain S-box-containing protein